MWLRHRLSPGLFDTFVNELPAPSLDMKVSIARALEVSAAVDSFSASEEAGPTNGLCQRDRSLRLGSCRLPEPDLMNQHVRVGYSKRTRRN
jgi:hypothetical protein